MLGIGWARTGFVRARIGLLAARGADLFRSTSPRRPPFSQLLIELLDFLRLPLERPQVSHHPRERTVELGRRRNGQPVDSLARERATRRSLLPAQPTSFRPIQRGLVRWWTQGRGG